MHNANRSFVFFPNFLFFVTLSTNGVSTITTKEVIVSFKRRTVSPSCYMHVVNMFPELCAPFVRTCQHVPLTGGNPCKLVHVLCTCIHWTTKLIRYHYMYKQFRQ